MQIHNPTMATIRPTGKSWGLELVEDGRRFVVPQVRRERAQLRPRIKVQRDSTTGSTKNARRWCRSLKQAIVTAPIAYAVRGVQTIVSRYCRCDRWRAAALPQQLFPTCGGGVESLCLLLILNGHYFSPISLATVGSIAADQIS